MKKYISILMAVIAWASVVIQYYLMIENRVASINETTVRFLSFYTILTNSLVAIYFTATLFRQKKENLSYLYKPGILTAVTVYITIVGLVYQILLRHIWAPTGMQMIVDEFLHTLIPLFVIIFWYLYEDKSQVSYKQIPRWLIYPLLYLAFILIRGYFSGFYPYPFIDVGKLGLPKVLINGAGLMVFFLGISALFIKIGRTQKSTS